MDAKFFLQDGALASTTQKLIQEVKTNPTNIPSRTLLFEVLCFGGDFEKAGRQLEVLEDQDKPNQLGIQVYKDLLTAEQKRNRLFMYGDGPDFFYPVEPYIEALLAAAKYFGEFRYGQGRKLLEASCQDWPNVSGNINDQPFSSFRDCYDLLAPILEVMVGANYYWVPWSAIKQITFEKPKYLRDLFWVQIQLMLKDGQPIPAFLPVLYPQSFSVTEENIKLGRGTTWNEMDEGIVVGKGQRIFDVDEKEYPILEVQTLEFTN